MYGSSLIIKIISAIVVIAIYFPDRHAKHYNYIKQSDVFNELVLQTDIFEPNPNLKNCSYKDLIINNRDIEIDSVYKKHKFQQPLLVMQFFTFILTFCTGISLIIMLAIEPVTIKLLFKIAESLKMLIFLGGIYFPKKCHPLFKVDIIIPYRNRSSQLEIFLQYMHHFLQQQQLAYSIIVVEQNDTLPFNRAKMLNYGARLAMSMNSKCLILHDVDLIPISTGNIYACTKRPRHMSSSLDTFRYNLPYRTLFGGAVAILSEQMAKVNGMSNSFYGWGGEDDDFYERLATNNLTPYRFDPKLSRYIMLNHKKEKASEERYQHLKDSTDRIKADGLSSLKLNYSLHLKELYTLLVVN